MPLFLEEELDKEIAKDRPIKSDKDRLIKSELTDTSKLNTISDVHAPPRLGLGNQATVEDKIDIDD